MGRVVSPERVYMGNGANDIFGLVGVALLAGCWIPQVRHLLRTRRVEGISPAFAAMILGANVFLTLHAIRIGSAIFAGVNAFSGLMAAVQLWLVVRSRAMEVP